MKKKFAEGVTFKKIFFIFLIGSIIGVIWEESYLYIKRLILDYDDTTWRFHRGVLYGPFNPVYGAGAAFLTILFAEKKIPTWKLFIYSSLLGGLIEFIMSYMQELIFNTTSWDYADKLFNIAGRTNLLYMLFFGLLGTLFIKYAYPYISNLLSKINIKIGNIIFYLLLSFMVINCTITFIASYRYVERQDDIEPSNYVDKLCDKYYPDEIIEKYFVNLIHKK